MRNCSQKVSMFIALLGVGFVGNTTQAHAGRKREIVEQVEVRTKAIRTIIGYQFSRSVRPGQVVLGHKGQEGLLKRTIKVVYKDGHPLRSELVKEVRIEPTPTVYLINRAGFETSRGSFLRSKVLRMRATGYDASPATIGPRATGRTCTGRKAKYGVAAVDPRVIPLGTILYVEGYGLAIAADRGRAIKGKRIDLCYDSKRVADRYGSKMVTVHILRTR